MVLNVHAKTKNGSTPLFLASARNTNPEVIKTLIENGTNVNSKDNDGNTPLIMGVKNNKNSEVIKVLLQAGAEVTKDVLNYVDTECTNTKIIKLFNRYKR